jgi:hypothetical protein
MSNITHYVRVVDGQVTDCWDSPPTEGVGNNGWMNAVEVKPEIIPGRQGYTGHIFDTTKDPVEIVYSTFDIGVGQRKSTMQNSAKFMFQQAVSQQAMNIDTFNISAITDAQATCRDRIAAINACNTHDDLDALPN